MSQGSLFSTYRAGENRVTASMLAVFERLEIARLERIIGAAMEEITFQLVRFQNQVTQGKHGTVPDAVIAADFELWIETKTTRNAVSRDQLLGHLQYVTDAPRRWLLVITPDVDRPSVIDAVGDQRVKWFNFAALSEAIDGLLDDSSEVVSEREAVLLRELQSMFAQDGLLAPDLDTVVVAAGDAYEEYLNRSVYVCQPNRFFKPVTHMAFYRRKRIEPQVPRILGIRDEISFTEEAFEDLAREAGGEPFAKVVRTNLDHGPRQGGGSYKIFLLSPPSSSDTVLLQSPISHEQRGAFTQQQRYVALSSLHAAASTTDL